MENLLVPLLILVAVFIGVYFVGRKLTGEAAEARHRERLLGSAAKETGYKVSSSEDESILKDDTMPHRWVMSLPYGDRVYDMALKANMLPLLPVIVLGAPIIAYFAFTAVNNFLDNTLVALLLGLFAGYKIPHMIMRRKIDKRNEAFINMFPDAVDMIVRSVKSGHPLNTALKMVADNMDDPVKSEFARLVDEIAYGRTNTEALLRLANRVDEADLHFFVVILSVQQETGGNLAEVLSNLSNIIRKRKQLRLKIKAMTSEGRATALILGSLPIVVFFAIYFTSPEYAKVMFETDSGRVVFASAISLIVICMVIINRMIKIDI